MARSKDSIGTSFLKNKVEVNATKKKKSEGQTSTPEALSVLAIDSVGDYGTLLLYGVEEGKHVQQSQSGGGAGSPLP